jgi:hypothetical protein
MHAMQFFKPNAVRRSANSDNIGTGVPQRRRRLLLIDEETPPARWWRAGCRT